MKCNVNKLVSIVLPVYNGERFLRESIDSILAQTYKNWELLILDDCSSDQSPVIAKEYVHKDNRIHYYRNETNLRLPGNLNRGFSLAKGDYLTWTSDDNLYLPTALERMAAVLDEGRADFVYASCRIIDESGKEIEYIMVNDDSPKQLVGHDVVGACFMYTRTAYEAVGDYDPEFTLVEDFDYWQRIATKFESATIHDILYKYRFHEGALTSTMKKDVFNQTLRRMLLKNRPAFGELSFEQNYYFYKGLNQCRVNLGERYDLNAIKYKCFSCIYFFLHRIPNKLHRMLSR